MSTTAYFTALAGGGLAIGALCGVLLPRRRTGGLPMAMLLGGAFTVIAGLFITEFFDIDQEAGFVALALGPLWAFTGRGHDGSGDSWSGGDSGGGDCGGGGGDGGGGCDGGGGD